MRISVVICTSDIDRLSYIIKTVHSIKNQTYKDHEVIVAVDHNLRLLKRLNEIFDENITMVLNKGQKGLSSTRNTGIKNASGDVIAFIDDDAFAEERWLERLLKNYKSDGVLGVGGKVVPLWENGRPSWFSEELDWIVGCSYKGNVEEKAKVGRLIGCNMSFRKEVFKKVGYFKGMIGQDVEKPLLRGDDTEFCIGVLNSIPNGSIIYDPSAVVYHNVPRSRASIRYVINRAFYGGMSIKILMDSLRSKPANVMSTEKLYLKHLLQIAIPDRIKKPRGPRDMYQIAVILLCIMAVMSGYIFERLIRKWSKLAKRSYT